MRDRLLWLLALPLLVLLLLPGLASAQPYLGLYLSGVPSSSHNLESIRTFTATGATDHFHVSGAKFGDSLVYGGLIGYQLIPRVAAELDVYHMSPGLKHQTRLASSPSAGVAVVTAGGDVDFTIAALSAVWNYRLLPSDGVPDGRLQLYLGAGGAVIQTDVDVTGFTTFGKLHMDDTDLSIAPQFKLGARWFFTKHLAAFLEGRWTYTAFAVESKGVTFAGAPFKLKVSGDADIPLALVGLSWHFK